MVFKPGQSGNPSGRPVGALCKVTVEAKEAIELAFDGMGGVEALIKWARANKGVFYSKVWSKLIPKNLQLMGADGKPVDPTVNNLNVLFNFGELVRQLKDVSPADFAALERITTARLAAPAGDDGEGNGSGQAQP